MSSLRWLILLFLSIFISLGLVVYAGVLINDIVTVEELEFPLDEL